MAETLEKDFPILDPVKVQLERGIKPSGLEKLRQIFPAHQISVFPKNAGQRAGLSYVGHAALTDRLLDADIAWAWEPLSVDGRGLPVIDDDGGMWIRLTVCGITRLGYGDAQGKTGGNAMKERIGDALRNAAMRFGAALDLWHKGDLHIDDAVPERKEPAKPELPPCPDAKIDKWIANVRDGKAQADELLPFVQAKHTITPEQLNRLSEFVTEIKHPPIDAEFVNEMEEGEKL